ncbi:hypothetical protein HWV62_7551 [Athelia sp. TMB]|nr:hypothetical protein HWV62_7551 [Athelia sp. TMB]
MPPRMNYALIDIIGIAGLSHDFKTLRLHAPLWETIRAVSPLPLSTDDAHHLFAEPRGRHHLPQRPLRLVDRVAVVAVVAEQEVRVPIRMVNRSRADLFGEELRAGGVQGDSECVDLALCL